MRVAHQHLPRRNNNNIYQYLHHMYFFRKYTLMHQLSVVVVCLNVYMRVCVCVCVCVTKNVEHYRPDLVSVYVSPVITYRIISPSYYSHPNTVFFRTFKPKIRVYNIICNKKNSNILTSILTYSGLKILSRRTHQRPAGRAISFYPRR